MSSSQIHGKMFEREVITTCFGVPAEQADKFNVIEAFDIPLGIITCKHPSGDPVSIKTTALKAATKAASVCLSDARRVWGWVGPVILVVGVYKQVREKKQIHTVHEFQLTLNADERGRLYGEITFADVAHFHETLKRYGRGQHAEARTWAKAQKKILAQKTGVIQLNPKIDSKMQRRLQCSAALSSLIAACAQHQEHVVNYRGLPLPFDLASSAREFAAD
jgi:hypothetical protein